MEVGAGEKGGSGAEAEERGGAMRIEGLEQQRALAA